MIRAIGYMAVALPLMAPWVWSDQASQTEPVARVGATEISRAQLEDAVSQALNTSYFHKNLDRERKTALEREQLQKLIDRELNYRGGLDRGLSPPTDAAEQARAAIESRLGSVAYEASLASVGMSRENHRDALAKTLLAAEAYRRFVADPAAVTDEDVRSAFEATPQHWRMPATVHVFHIVLPVPPGSSAEVEVATLAQGASLVDRLHAGEAFADLARQYSRDRWRIKGGDLGWVRKGQLVEPLETAVWSAEVNEIVGPIRSAEGFHIAKVVGRRSERPMEFAEVEPMLRERLETERLKAAEAAWYGPSRSKYPVVILDRTLDTGE